MSIVDWSKVKTERQAEEEAIRRGAERLLAQLGGVEDELIDMRESPDGMTPRQSAETHIELARDLAELVRLFRAHLAADDLDDQAKAIGVSGGHLSAADIAKYRQS